MSRKEMEELRERVERLECNPEYIDNQFTKSDMLARIESLENRLNLAVALTWCEDFADWVLPWQKDTAPEEEREPGNEDTIDWKEDRMCGCPECGGTVIIKRVYNPDYTYYKCQDCTWGDTMSGATPEIDPDDHPSHPDTSSVPEDNEVHTEVD